MDAYCLHGRHELVGGRVRPAPERRDGADDLDARRVADEDRVPVPPVAGRHERVHDVAGEHDHVRLCAARDADVDPLDCVLHDVVEDLDGADLGAGDHDTLPDRVGPGWARQTHPVVDHRRAGDVDEQQAGLPRADLEVAALDAHTIWLRAADAANDEARLRASTPSGHESVHAETTTSVDALNASAPFRCSAFGLSGRQPTLDAEVPHLDLAAALEREGGLRSGAAQNSRRARSVHDDSLAARGVDGVAEREDAGRKAEFAAGRGQRRDRLLEVVAWIGVDGAGALDERVDARVRRVDRVDEHVPVLGADELAGTLVADSVGKVTQRLPTSRGCGSGRVPRARCDSRRSRSSLNSPSCASNEKRPQQRLETRGPSHAFRLLD